MPYFLRLKAGESLITGSSRYGNIRFLNPVNGSGGNFTADVYVLNNSVTVVANSTYNPGFNKSANITLYGLAASGYSAILRDGVQCPLTVCYAFTDLNAGTVAFNVSSWSNYSIGNDTILPTINFTNPTPANATTQIGNSIFVNVSATDINYISSFIDFDNSLVAWWRMDDLNSSGGVVDYMGRNNGSVVGGAVQNVSGKIGKSFSFDGAGDYVELGDGSLNYNSDTSVSMWFYALNITDFKRLFNMDSSNNNNFLIGFFDNQIYVDDGVVGGARSGTINANQWYHVVVLFNNTNIQSSKVYLNGVDSTAGTIGATMSVTSTTRITSTSTVSFNGSIDDVMIFNRSLSAGEVMALYANTTSKYYSNNFTSLAGKTYNFKAYAQDIAGNVNFTELRTVTVGPISVSGCTVLNVSGVYAQSGNIVPSDASVPCVNITASNV